MSDSKRLSLHPTQIVVIAFGTAVAIGTTLLMIPIATNPGYQTDIVTALFTAVSAVCLTGLTVVETASHWSGFGQFIIMALIQLERGIANEPDLSPEEALAAFDAQATRIYELMEAKNHDYGEAWRDMRITSLTDLILQKVLRVKQIEDNRGATLVSEGVDANYMDMVNYAVFALILMHQG